MEDLHKQRDSFQEELDRKTELVNSLTIDLARSENLLAERQSLLQELRQKIDLNASLTTELEDLRNTMEKKESEMENKKRMLEDNLVEAYRENQLLKFKLCNVRRTSTDEEEDKKPVVPSQELKKADEEVSRIPVSEHELRQTISNMEDSVSKLQQEQDDKRDCTFKRWRKLSKQQKKSFNTSSKGSRLTA
ncbi:hypothetical protein WMY93_020533 [Mugilogobius chulae]|uniref:Uncharacterized protein n=1 Tax=Mugilogobius chulae TaxID=88201 RepID=A0AAW0N850_9GOBI